MYWKRLSRDLMTSARIIILKERGGVYTPAPYFYGELKIQQGVKQKLHYCWLTVNEVPFDHSALLHCVPIQCWVRKQTM